MSALFRNIGNDKKRSCFLSALSALSHPLAAPNLPSLASTASSSNRERFSQLKIACVLSRKAQTAQNKMHRARFHGGMFINVYISIPSQLATLCMLHQTSLATLNEELEREKEQFKTELKLAEERLMILTSVHEQCHDTKQALENELMQLTGRLEKATLESNTTDLMQIVNEQTLQVTPVDTPVNDFVNSMSCFKPSCCPMSNVSLLQEIERLNGKVNEYEAMIHPIPLYTPGRLLFHPDGSEDLEARAIMENAFHESILTKRVGNNNAVADIFERIGSLICPDSTEDGG